MWSFVFPLLGRPNHIFTNLHATSITDAETSEYINENGSRGALVCLAYTERLTISRDKNHRCWSSRPDWCGHWARFAVATKAKVKSLLFFVSISILRVIKKQRIHEDATHFRVPARHEHQYLVFRCFGFRRQNARLFVQHVGRREKLSQPFRLVCLESWAAKLATEKWRKRV